MATGEHVHNRVMFKQLPQADAVDVVQIDATRVGRYAAPTAPGFSARMHDESVARYSYPDGPEWKTAADH